MNQPVFFVSNIKPISYNVAHGKTKQDYKSKLSKRFKKHYAHLYSGLPTIDSNLRSRIVYLHHNLPGNESPDVDNLSKPIVDAFNGVIYSDDKQIKSRSADEYELDELKFITVDYSSMPYNIAFDLHTFITNKEQHIILFSVSNNQYKDIKIGEI